MLPIRKRIPLFLFLTALIAAPASHALSFGAGPIVGAEFANASIENHDNSDGRTGLVAGLRTEFGVTRPFSLVLEPAYVQKGARFDTFGGLTRARGDLDYFEVPVLFKAKFGALAAHAYGIVGPSFGLNVNAKGKLGSFTEDFKDRAASFVVSGDIGAGVGFRLRKFVFFTADGRYSHGFTNALDKSVGDIGSWESRDIRVTGGLLIHLVD